MYFDQHRIPYETADFGKPYDAVYVSLAADLNEWCEYKAAHASAGKSPRVIFDLSDSYLSADPFSDRLRSVYHYLTGRTRKLTLSYKESVLRMIQASDVLLCGSHEQRAALLPLHKNVVIMRDYYGYAVRSCKASFRLAGESELHVLWEGLSHGNIGSFRLLREILEGLPGTEVHLHIVTDSTYCRVGSKHLCQPTYTVLEKVFAGSRVTFHMYDWNSATFSSIAAACDLALIPIPDDPIKRNKPENKLLLLWSIGLPVITSSTPSYARVMKAVGAEELACATPADWRRAILDLVSSEERRAGHMRTASAYVAEHCADEVLLTAWEAVFNGPTSDTESRTS